jgi:predicted RNA-binding protein with PIN domain
MPILIDGHNLIGRLPRGQHPFAGHRVPALSLEDAQDEEGLVRWLMSYHAHTGKAITVVFDPGETFSLSRVHDLAGVRVVFAPQGSSADDLIIRQVRSSRNPQAWLVVTSDKELAQTVARQGARVQSADAFAAGLIGQARDVPGEKDAPLSPEEVEEWLALFEGQDPEHSAADSG